MRYRMKKKTRKYHDPGDPVPALEFQNRRASIGMLQGSVAATIINRRVRFNFSTFSRFLNPIPFSFSSSFQQHLSRQ